MPGSGGLIGWAVGTPLAAGVGTVVTVVLLVPAGLLRPAGHHRDPGAPDPRAAARARRPAAGPRRVRRGRRGLRRRGRRGARSERRAAAAASAGSRCRRTCSTTGPIDLGAARRPPPTRRSPPARAGAHARCRPPVVDRTAPPEDLPPIDEPAAAAPSSRSQGNYVLPSLTVLRPGHAAAGPLEGQRRRHRGDHRRPRAVQHRRRRHRLHPRPDGHPLRGRARPGGQGREDHRADPQPRLRRRQRQHPHPGADPRQVRRRHRGAQHRPRDGQPRRRHALAGGQAGPAPDAGRPRQGHRGRLRLRQPGEDAAPAGRRCDRCR